MSRFKRKVIKFIKPKKEFAKPWLDPDYDVLAKNRIRVSPPTDIEHFQCNCLVARQMKEQFKWQPWMDDFIDKNGNDLPYKSGVTGMR